MRTSFKLRAGAAGPYASAMNNLFDQIPDHAPEEIFTELLAAKTLRIERIVSFGQASPEGFWYEQPENEWVVLLEGFAQLRLNDQLVSLAPGDYLHIPARLKHRVELTDPAGRTVWLAIFYQ